jgi:hypothetical protein
MTSITEQNIIKPQWPKIFPAILPGNNGMSEAEEGHVS